MMRSPVTVLLSQDACGYGDAFGTDHRAAWIVAPIRPMIIETRTITKKTTRKTV